MNNIDSFIQYVTDPSASDETLRSSGISNDNLTLLRTIKERLALLCHFESEETKKRVAQMEESSKDSFRIIKELKSSLEDVVKESRTAQDMTKIMFGMTFLLGFVLIGVAVYFGIKGNQVLAIAFGSFGIIDIIAHLIADPPLKIQDSRSNYAQLAVGMMAWFNDLMDKSGMAVYDQQLYIRLQSLNLDVNSIVLLQEKHINNYLAISGAQMENTVRLLKLLDEVAEPTRFRNVKSKEGKTEDINHE